ncbi:sugar phosphate isomerases/epimerase [Klebsiella pneumoniae]|nr:sugar phosphate isomerases/epimerase [Klebsiella pneumoniae]
MLGDTPAVRATLAALMETGIRVSDVEIVRLTPGFTLDDRLQRFYGDRRASWRRTGVSRRQ